MADRPRQRRSIPRQQRQERGAGRLPARQRAGGLRDGPPGRDHVHGARLERADPPQARLRVRAGDEGAASASVPRHESLTRAPSMRAVVCRAWGAVDDLRVEEVATPIPGPDEVLITVKATAVNYADALMTAGRYQTRPELPFSPGLETAGVVAACGEGVTRLKPGDRVMAILAYGGLAEMAVAPESETYAIPAGTSFEEAGAFPVAYISSHVAIRWQGRLEAGETLLVLGAAGGVGLTAVEIGKAMGARVIAAASTPEKLAVARERGADDLVNYTTEKLTERVMALTEGSGADVCFDPVGGDLFDAALSALGWGGRILVVGFVGGVQNIPANRLLVKNRAALGSSLRYYRWRAPDKLRRSVDELVQWYEAGKLRPCISHRLPLEKSVEAIRLLTERRAYGKVVVVPGLQAD